MGAAVCSVQVANLLTSLALMMSLLCGSFLLDHDQAARYCTWFADLPYSDSAYEALAVRFCCVILFCDVLCHAAPCCAVHTATSVSLALVRVRGCL